MILFVHVPKWLRQSSICLQCRRPVFHPWVGKIPWRRKWQPTLVFLPGESHGQRNLVGYITWSRKELDTTEQLHFHFRMCVCVCVCVCVCKTILQVNVAGNIQSQDSKADCLGLNWVPSLTSSVTPDSLLTLSVS